MSGKSSRRFFNATANVSPSPLHRMEGREVNALLCTSAKVNRSAKSTEEVLDEADGLDWKTMVRCDKIHLLPKARFDDRKGHVTEERRYLIARKMVEVLRLPIHRR